MDNSRERPKAEAAKSGKAAENPSSAGSKQLLHVITALNLVRMSLEMYPPGHSRIAESIDSAFDMIQKILREKSDVLIGFTGDTMTFGETAPEREKKNAAFREYARTLNNLRIVSFTLNRGLKKEDLREFNRILAAKPSDIWALGKIESVVVRAGITGIKVKVIDADHFRLEEKKKVIQAKVDKKEKDEHFWQGLFERLKSETLKRSQSEGSPMDQQKLAAVEAIRSLNKEPEHWPSAVFSYEKMIHEYFSETPEGKRIDTEQYEVLTNVSSLVSNLHPELKKQLIDVVERQMILHPDTALVEENLQCFPNDIFIEIIRQTNERKAQISPALVNLLKKMADIQEAPAAVDHVKEKDFSSKDLETLLKREEYENYVPEDYDRILKKATATSSSDGDIDESRFPLQEYLKTLTYEHIDFQICQLIHYLMDEEITEEDYLACAQKITKSIPELLKAGKFSFLTTFMETLRRHGRDKPTDNIRQKALFVLRALSEQKTVAKNVTPHILKGTADPVALATFLISSGPQNLSWLFDLYLDPKARLSATITTILKGFGTNAIEEALKRLTGQDSDTIIRLLTFIREMNDRSVTSSLKNLFHHEDWAVRREVIKIFNQFGDPAVIEPLRRSLKAENRDEVFEAVGLSCRGPVADLLEDLTAMLKIVVIPEENAILNEWIVGELAKTGHPSVVPDLERIAATWFTFAPKSLSRMKVALYRNLGHFPKNAILKLLKKGNRSRNREIKAVCLKIEKSKE